MDRIIKRVDFPKIMQPQALKVCAYTRVSSGKDAMLHSLSAQVSHYSEMIQSHIGWVYCGVYSDEALTGTKSDREGFQQMLTDCREKLIWSLQKAFHALPATPSRFWKPSGS